jgi:xanthine dehydrogenase YagS FAD-binding subunit
MLPTFTYVSPKTRAELMAQAVTPGAVLHAGGTDLLGCLRDGVFQASKVVSLNGLKELRGIEPTREGGLRIGALTTLAEIAEHPTIRERYPALAQGAASAASPQLRNQGTLGGNLCQRPRCWYFRGDFHCLRKGGGQCYAAAGQNQYHCILGGAGCYIVHPSDTAPALVALGAQVRIVTRDASRLMALEAFFVPPSQSIERENVLQRGELLYEVLLPPAPAGMRSRYRKARARGSFDFALAGVAVAAVVTDGKVQQVRMVLSGVAPIPWRATEAEAALVGKPLDADAIGRAAAASVAGAQPLAHNGYKVHLVKGLVAETLEALV